MPFAFGETSYYNSCFCDTLEDVGFSDPGVPPIPPNAYPDARYPNLFLYWYITDGRPGQSPGGRRLIADGIAYHSYLDDAAAFPNVQYDVMKMDGANQGLYCFRNPNYYTGRYYGSVPIALTEWGFEDKQGQEAVNFLNNVWHSDTFHNSGLNNALWYCDWCGTAHAKGIFKNINPPTSPGDCALTSLAEPAGCTDPPPWGGPPYGVCGTTLRDLKYPWP